MIINFENWISVNDKLPAASNSDVRSLSIPVLVAIQDGSGHAFVSIDRYENYSNLWACYSAETGFEVTFWTKLPCHPNEF